MKILIMNGPNINMLGVREPEIYGTMTYAKLVELIKNYCDEKKVECDFFQSNHEGALVDEIQKAYGVYDGIVMNPAAYTHTSVAIPDAIKAVKIPTVEIHISEVDSREAFRRINYVREACIRTISGLGTYGYLRGVDALIDHFRKNN